MFCAFRISPVILIPRQQIYKSLCSQMCPSIMTLTLSRVPDTSVQTSAYNVISQLLKQNGSPVFRIQNAKKIGKAMEHTISKLYYEQEVGDVELSCLAYQCLFLHIYLKKKPAYPRSNMPHRQKSIMQNPF